MNLCYQNPLKGYPTNRNLEDMELDMRTIHDGDERCKNTELGQGSNWQGLGFNHQFPCSFHCDPNPLVPDVVQSAYPPMQFIFSQFEPMVRYGVQMAAWQRRAMAYERNTHFFQNIFMDNIQQMP